MSWCLSGLKLFGDVANRGWVHVYTILSRSKTKQDDNRTFAVPGQLLGECEECLEVPISAIGTMNVTKFVVGMETFPLYQVMGLYC